MMNWLKKLIILILLVLVTQLQKKSDYNTKVNEIQKKITDHDHDKYNTTQKLNNFTTDNFAARSKRSN